MKTGLMVLLSLTLVGCATHQRKEMSEQEMLKRYGDVPLIPDGMAWMIDDRNRELGIKDDTDYAQAFLTDLTQGQVALMTAQQLDKGDVATARRMLLTSVKLNVGFLPVYQKRAKIDQETLANARNFAKDVLEYLIDHKEELDPRYPDLRGALVGLAQLLADDPEQMRRLEELLDNLKQKNATAAAEQRGGGYSPPATRSSKPTP